MLSLLLAVPSCIYSFWHGVIPTSYFIFNDFYTCTIEDLEESATYSITVRATNAVGSAVSPGANGMTSEASKISQHIVMSCVNMLFSAVPSGSPTVVSATSTSTTITVHWEPVDCIDRNGVITSYSVQYEAVDSGTSECYCWIY